MNVIFTNDDGIHAAGLRALVDRKPGYVNAVVVAPANERSASSHSISLGQKLRVEQFEENGIPHYMIHGTPADCIKFAVSELKEVIEPDLIISGINQGANTGVSVFYSGTISAAREGLINRIPSMALSLCSRKFRDFTASVETALRLMEGYQAGLFPRDVLVNVNMPPLEYENIAGIRVTKQADSRFVEEFVKDKAHDGKRVYTLAGEIELYEPDGTSDEEAVNAGYVSLTPLKLDMTDYKAMPRFEDWMSQKEFDKK